MLRKPLIRNWAELSRLQEWWRSGGNGPWLELSTDTCTTTGVRSSPELSSGADGLRARRLRSSCEVAAHADAGGTRGAPW
jgi:hypothetical protein